MGQGIPEFEKEALTFEEQAEDLVMEVSELEEDAVANILEAVELDPECIMAYDYLGNMQPAPPLAIAYYAYGVQIGREKFQKEIKENMGELWYHHHMRPFLRYRNNYAHCLYTIGRV